MREEKEIYHRPNHYEQEELARSNRDCKNVCVFRKTEVNEKKKDNTCSAGRP